MSLETRRPPGKEIGEPNRSGNGNHRIWALARLRAAWRPGRRKQLDLACLTLASVILSVQFLRLHAAIAPSAAPDMAFLRDPHATPTAGMGWWAWWDQGFYQKAAVAWANGVADPVFHWYLPGYPLLGAAFVHVTPADPFLLPNLVSFLGTLWLFCGLASRLLQDVPLRIPVACGLFVATSALSPRVLWSWVVPWTTTPETLCIFGALLGAIRLVEGGKRRDAFLTGLAISAIAGFRPADAGVVGLAICAVAGPALLSRPQRLAGALAAAGGALVPLLIFGGAYLATWGTTLSAYLALSSQIGFEPRLLALRWVTLMLDPRPLYPGGRGLAEVFFWVLPGFAGMAATLFTARRTAVFHGLVIGALVGDIVLFLTYRDLHPTGLWDHGNYHYFKWTLPLLALYAFRLLPMALNRDRRRPVSIAAACLTIPALSCWQAGISRVEPVQADQGSRSVTIKSGLRPVSAMVLVPGHGSGASDVVYGSAETASGTVLRHGLDFVMYDAKGMLRIVPLRPLPAEPTTFRFPEGTYLNQKLTPLLARQAITWSLPFWLAGRFHAREAFISR